MATQLSGVSSSKTSTNVYMSLSPKRRMCSLLECPAKTH